MRILLIEDDEDVASLVRDGLKAANHEVTYAADGESGMAAALHQRFDVMIFDRQLPGGVDGANLLRDLRGARVETPALILSALGGLCNWMQGLESGGDDYIEKPFSFADLLGRVEALHQRRLAAGR
jgi:two-component system, OmpR family, response regulator